MFDDFTSDGVFESSDALDALRDLEMNSHDAFVAQRASERVEIRARLVVRYGNASQRHQMAVEGLTADISNGGCMALLPRPLMAGDYFWLTFEEDDVRVGSILARCLRCRLVQEETYEMGFQFVSAIDLTTALAKQMNQPT